MSLDSRKFRDTVGYFATGVTIITTLDREGGPVGLTVNSFSSLSLDPPLVLFCLDRNVQSVEAFHANRHFAVNVLSEEQEEVSRRFSQTGAEKWRGLAFDTWETGCPILRGCIANIECGVESIFEGGDHVVIVGGVVRMNQEDGEVRPLTFFRGNYGGIAAR